MHVRSEPPGCGHNDVRLLAVCGEEASIARAMDDVEDKLTSIIGKDHPWFKRLSEAEMCVPDSNLGMPRTLPHTCNGLDYA